MRASDLSGARCVGSHRWRSLKDPQRDNTAVPTLGMQAPICGTESRCCSRSLNLSLSPPVYRRSREARTLHGRARLRCRRHGTARSAREAAGRGAPGQEPAGAGGPGGAGVVGSGRRPAGGVHPLRRREGGEGVRRRSEDASHAILCKQSSHRHNPGIGHTAWRPRCQ